MTRGARSVNISRKFCQSAFCGIMSALGTGLTHVVNFASPRLEGRADAELPHGKTYKSCALPASAGERVSSVRMVMNVIANAMIFFYCWASGKTCTVFAASLLTMADVHSRTPSGGKRNSGHAAASAFVALLTWRYHSGAAVLLWMPNLAITCYIGLWAKR